VREDLIRNGEAMCDPYEFVLNSEMGQHGGGFGPEFKGPTAGCLRVQNAKNFHIASKKQPPETMGELKATAFQFPDASRGYPPAIWLG
jgi:hypothetical protein